MFNHLFNKWMISGEPVPYTKTNRTGKARTVGYIEVDPEIAEHWAKIFEIRARRRLPEGAYFTISEGSSKRKRDVLNDINYAIAHIN